jgi:hypothetical protein
MATSPSTSNQLTARQQYGLEHLAEHLKQARQYERLRLLFAGDEWMHIRVTSSNFVYSGFINDLETAWVAFGEADKTARARVTALSDYIRLGLIGSSVTSLSTRPINLLVNAVAAGCWVPARALAVAALNPSVVERIVIYTGLLMIEDLDVDTRDQIQQLVCRTVAEAPDTIPIRYLARVLPCLKGAAFEDILGQVMRRVAITPLVPATQGWFSVQFTGEDQQIYIDEAISLLEHVPAGRRVPILERIAAAVLDCARRVAAEPEAPEEEEGAVNNLWNVVVNQTLYSMRREGENPEVLGRQLQQIAPYVRESQSVDSVLAHVVEALEVTADPVFHRLVVSEYASILHDELLDRAVSRAVELSQSPVLPEILTALAPHLDAGRLAYVRERVAAFGDERQRALATEALARGRNVGTFTVQTVVREQADSVSGVSSLDAGALREASASTEVVPLSNEYTGQPDSDVLAQIFRPGGDYINRGAERFDLRVGSQKPSLSGEDAHAKGAPELAQQREAVLARLIASTFPNIDLQQMELAASQPPAHVESSPATGDPRRDSYTSRLYALGELLLYAPYLSDAELCAATERSLSPDETVMQIEMLDKLASLLSEIIEADERFSEVVDADDLANSVRRVKGVILRGALKLAYQSPLEPDPWQTLPTTVLGEADLSLVLEYVLTLPAEVERNQFVWALHGKMVDEHQRCLLLKGLEPLLTYLNPSLLGRAVTHVNALTNVRVREQALNLIAPYLSGNQLEQVLAQQAISDAQEQAQLLASLAAITPEGERESVSAWVVNAALEGADGELLGELLGDLLVGVNREIQESLLEQALANITRRQPNDQLDALMRLAQKWPDPLPRQILDVILRLPAESERSKFTWRGYAIISLMKRFPDDMLPEVWDAIQALPPYLHIGEPGSMGWHWSYSYPYAAALHTLTPRVTGTLLEEIFAAACALYWKPREEIMQLVAEKASGELASQVLDHTLTMLEGYSSADLSANALWRDEMAIYTGPIDQFRVERQVAAAEVIAVLAPQLNTEDLRRVLQSLHLFSNAGPRAWLPGKLLPYLKEEQQRQILPSAIVAAFEFIGNDPTRLDLVTALLPFLRAAMEEEVAPIRELTQKYFPNREEIFLTQEDLEVLLPEDRACYKQLTAKYFTPEMREAMQSLEEDSSDDDKRRLMEQAVLTPLFSTHIEQLALHLLTISPLLRRVEALPSLSQELRTSQFTTLVSQTFDELLTLRRQNVDEFTDSMIDMLPHLPADLHQTLLDIALGLDPPSLLREEELEVNVYGKLLKELPERPAVPSDDRPYGPLLGLLMYEEANKKFRETLGHLLGNRERLLAALLPRLDASLTAQLVDAVLMMPEAERVGAIFMLMPHLSAEHKAQAHENILTMQSAFGRTWLPWHMSKYFSDEQRRAAIPAALAAVHDLRTPEGQVISLFGLLGLADDDSTRQQMLQRILDSLGQIEEVSDRLHVLSLFISMAKGQQELLTQAVEIMLQVRDTKWRTQLLVLFCKAAESHGNLAQEFFLRARPILIEELHDSAKLERSSYLRVLRNLCPAFKLLTDPDDTYMIAKSSREICTGWNWL